MSSFATSLAASKFASFYVDFSSGSPENEEKTVKAQESIEKAGLSPQPECVEIPEDCSRMALRTIETATKAPPHDPEVVQKRAALTISLMFFFLSI